VAQSAIETFGRIDTWVNNAGIGIYGRLWEIPTADKRRLFDVNSTIRSMNKAG
jgi:short-subunit dehydrogenase